MRHYRNSSIRSGVLRYLNGRFENVHMLPDVYITTTNAANGNESRIKQSFKVAFFTVYVLFHHPRHFHRVCSVFLEMNLIIHCRVTQLENDCGSGIIQKDNGKLHRYQTKKKYQPYAWDILSNSLMCHLVITVHLVVELKYEVIICIYLTRIHLERLE